MKRILITLGLLGIGLAGAGVTGTTTGIGKIAMDNANAGLLYFTRADGNDFLCVGSGTDKQRMYVPSGFTTDQRKSYLSLVLFAKSVGNQVAITYETIGSGGKCEIIDIELQN